MQSHHIKEALKDNMTEEQRDNLVQIINNTGRYVVRKQFRIYPVEFKEGHVKFAGDYVPVATFSHTFVHTPHDKSQAFRYHIRLSWEEKDFTKEYHDDLRKIVEDFEKLSSVDEGEIN